MNKRLFNFFVGFTFLCSATLPIQGMSFVRRFGGSVAAAARMVTARVASSTPRVAQAPVRSLAKISGRSAMNPLVSQAVRRASTHAKFDVKKLLSRAQEVGGAIAVAGTVGIVAYEANEQYTIYLPRDLRRIFEKNDDRELGRWFRKYDCDEALQKKIINYCMTHWDTLNVDMLCEVVNKVPGAAQAFTQSAADNIAEIVESYNGCKLVHKIMEKNPAAAQAFAQSAADNIARLVWLDGDLLYEIMEKNPAAVQAFTQSAADNMVELVKSYCGKELLNNLMKKNPATVQIFTQSAADNITELAKNKKSRDFLDKIIESNSSAMELFAQAAEKAGIETDFTLLLQIQKKHAHGEQLSPSEAHLLANKHLVLDELLPQDVQELQHTVLMKEHQLLDAGYVPFYHAQSNEKWFPIELDTFLHGIQSGEQVDEFYLMHTQADLLRKKVRDVVSESGAMHEAIMHDYLKAKDALERERLVHASKGGGDDRKRMLFLNGSLRGNASNWGSQSFPHYFMKNYNEGGKHKQLGDIMRNVFKDRGLDSMYEQFKDELRQLHEEYIKLSKYGTLYQIAIPRDKVGQVVRPALDDGGKVNLCTSKGYLWDRHTDNMHEIIAASSNPDTHPGDQNEFVAMMTYDENGLMNPKCGAKIKAYMIPTDEAKYQEWCAKWEDLKARIKAEVERTRPADYVAPAHVQELVGLYADAYARSSKPHLYGSRGWLKWLFG